VINANASCNSIYIHYGSVTVNAGHTLSYYGQLSNFGTLSGTAAAGVKATFYRDADGDGRGAAGNSTQACTAPAGYVGSDDDCDDTDNSVYPGATEACDGKDNDCDGQTDEGAQNTFYRDADGDGYGNSALTTQACSAPAGFVGNNTDCDDGNANINPGRTEICGNGIDDNCNGQTDEGCVTAPAPTVSINDVTVNEAQGIAALTITLSNTYTQDIKVTYQTTDRTAVSKGKYKDFVAAKGSVTIPAGQLSGSIIITILTDNLQEPDEVFDVSVSPDRRSPATIAKGTGTVTIKDGATLISRSARPTEASENDPETFKASAYPNPGDRRFTLQVSGNRKGTVSVIVYDMLGRVVQQVPTLGANTTLEMGSAYQPGTYVVEVRQGQEKRQFKWIKVSR
jgi:hypothetical protein